MKRTTWMWIQIVSAWAAFVLFAVASYAEPLVRAYASVDATASIWAAPKDAQFVERLRGAEIAVVSVADVLPTDRLKSCDHESVVAGSAVKCPNTLPDGSNWRRVSVLFPPAPPPVPSEKPSVLFGWTPPTQNKDGSALTDLVGYRVSLRYQNCDPALPGCQVAHFEPSFDIGPVDRFRCVNVVFECWITLQVINSEGTVSGVTPETKGSPKRIPGQVTDLRQIE
jgi:hypothetical protein